MRRFERKEAKASSNPYAAASDSTDESESSTGLSNGEMSPASTTATSLSVGASRAKFEGAHLFAGHADAYVPTLPTTPQAMAAALKGLSEKLKEASGALVATKRERDALKAEVEMIGLEKTEIETNLSLELQSAEESIHSLEEDLRGVHEERKVWERDKAAMEAQLNQVREERQVIESEGVGQSQEVILARDSLKALCRANRIVTPLMASDLMTFVTAIEGHLAEGNKLNADRHEELNSSLEEARREIKQMEAKLKVREMLPESLLPTELIHSSRSKPKADRFHHPSRWHLSYPFHQFQLVLMRTMIGFSGPYGPFFLLLKLVHKSLEALFVLMALPGPRNRTSLDMSSLQRTPPPSPCPNWMFDLSSHCTVVLVVSHHRA